MIGQTISHYRILEKLGEGGMGAVYLAVDTELDRKVALKFLSAEVASAPDRLARFEREARIIARINHPSVVTLHSVEEHDGVHFIVMEHVEGSTLDMLIGRDGMPLKRFFEVAISIADALKAAHDQGVVHRDLKPTNIMVTNDGLVKVLDFGLARPQEISGAVSEDSETKLKTRKGVIMGTAPYMSPEQASSGRTDHRSDIFSLGIVLYEMASGVRPFRASSTVATIAAILKDSPRPLAERRSDLPEHLCRIVHRCLEKEPADRYQSISELAVELRRLHQEAASSPPLPESDSDDPKAKPEKASPGIGTSMPQSDDAGAHSPDQIRSWPRKWLPVAIVVTSLAFILVAYFVFPSRDGPGPLEHTSLVEKVPDPPVSMRLAVLPFSNLRSDPETDFLGYALADQVIGSLVYVRDLTVRPSSSVRRFQNGDYDLDEVEEELEVNFVLAGNYLQQGDTIRLTVELIDLESDQTVWREPIEVAYQDAFAMQDLVSQRLLSRLEISFSEDERNRMNANVSRNPLAYEYYLRSLSYPEEPTGNQLAVEMLRQSVDLDSAFAPAWDALGRRTQLMGYWELGGQDVSTRAKEFFLKALELNPGLFNALAHLTMLHTDFGETDLAMKKAQRMLEINPNSAEGMFAYGYVLRYAGMIEESALAMDTALERDPTNPTFKSAFWTFIFAGRYDDAMEALSLGQPALREAWEGEIAYRRGREDVARTKWTEAIASDPEGIPGLWATGLLSALNGDYGHGIEAARKWETANLADGEGWFFLAGLYCINGEIEQCTSALDTAVDRGWFAYPHMIDCRFLDPARGTRGFDAVLEKARLKHEAFQERFF